MTFAAVAAGIAGLMLMLSRRVTGYEFLEEAHVAASSFQDPGEVSNDSNLRMVTFNAKFLPLIFTSNAVRAKDLARRIRAGNYDIVGLNEVFDERARRILVTQLSPRYPYIVHRIGGRRLKQDSGLMLFSMFPFVSAETHPESATVKPHGSRVEASTLGAVTFREYSDCAWTDCLAAKGVAHVRLRAAERDLDLFFTHLQATYIHHSRMRRRRSRDVRAKQLDQLASLAAEILSSDRTRGTTAIFLGDLNVPGRPAKSARHSDDAARSLEWYEMMGTLGQPMNGLLQDVWYEHAPTGWPGLTYPATRPRARFDYILVGSPDRDPALCIRSVALDSLMATPENTNREAGYLSDHFGVRADIRLGTDTCAGEVS